MRIIKRKSEIQKIISPINHKYPLGFVPTMGALHAGHLSLIKKSQQENEYTICSIFVNPTQFNNSEDLKYYPRTPDQDLEQLRSVGCDFVFMPDASEMYQDTVFTSFDFGVLEQGMEGKHRPKHFNGVGIVVSKLLNIIRPNRAYFGQKDLQQFVIVRQMVHDLSMQTKVVACPIVREADGLAMSSRNLRLTPAERQVAPQIYQAIKKCALMLKQGASVLDAQRETIHFLDQFHVFHTEYIDIVNTDNLEPILNLQYPEKTAVCIASHLGSVRLIDNVIVSDVA